MRRTILAILIGMVTTGLTAAVGGLCGVGYYVQEALAWVVPLPWTADTFALLHDSAIPCWSPVPGSPSVC